MRFSLLFIAATATVSLARKDSPEHDAGIARREQHKPQSGAFAKRDRAHHRRGSWSWGTTVDFGSGSGQETGGLENLLGAGGSGDGGSSGFSTSWSWGTTIGGGGGSSAAPSTAGEAEGQAETAVATSSSYATKTKTKAAPSTPSTTAATASGDGEAAGDASTAATGTSEFSTSFTLAATATTTAQTTGTVQSISIDAHNQLRAKHSGSNLTWNSTLADAATTWANKCVYKHGGGTDYSAGENIAAYTISSGTAQDVAYALSIWSNESSLYSYTSPGYSDATGHFTQQVWLETQSVGCADVACSPLYAEDGSEMYDQGRFTVCEY